MKNKQKKIFGIGLDDDGHTRITKTKNMILQGGSEQTHDKMQEVSIRFEEKLKGKSLNGMSTKELSDRINEAVDKSS